MSYYESNYYQQPPAPYGPGGDFNMPVPGWGTLPQAAGPARVGMGAVVPMVGGGPQGQNVELVLQLANAKAKAACESGSGTWDGSVCHQPGGFPWWGWVVGAGVLGVGAAVAVNRRWI